MEGTKNSSRTGSAGKHRPRVILASRSPRRRTLLSEFGVAHDAEQPAFDDATLSVGSATPRQWVASLAYLKAASHAVGRMEGDAARVVLGADTVCVRDGQIIGTPVDAADARRILRTLSDGEHEVLTGVAIVETAPGRPAVRQIFVDSAMVRMGSLSESEIDEYVDGGAWHGKAGAYNLAERLEAGWPIEYTGDPSTIMGLPMRALLPRLRRLGVIDEEAASRG